MKDLYSEIVEKDPEAMQKIDEVTIKYIELKAPGSCRADANELYGKLKQGKIFGAFSDRDREAIWSRVCTCTRDRLVPLFSKLFQGPELAEGVDRLPPAPDVFVTSGHDPLRSRACVFQCEPARRPVCDRAIRSHFHLQVEGLK